jgi:hypothetical protein
MIRTAYIIICIGLSLTLGCYTPRLETTWRNANIEPVSYRKLAVVVLSGSPGERRAIEDEIVNEIRATPAVASYPFVKDVEVRNRDTVVQRLQNHNCDAAMIVRLIVPDNPHSYVPGKDNYFTSTTDYTYEPPRITPRADTVDAPVRAEVSLYSVADGRLLWAGSGSSRAPVNARRLATGVARASVAELRGQGLVW